MYLGESYIDSPDWIKNKKATINSINKKYNKCFQYAVTVAFNSEQIGKHAEIITKIKPFINKYKYDGINFPPKIKTNNVTTALNVLYGKKEKIHPAYISKNNSNCEKQVTPLMIPNGEKGRAKPKGR